MNSSRDIVAYAKMQTIGFIGLSDMSGPMAGNLATSGLSMTVFDIPPKTENNADSAQTAESVAATAADWPSAILEPIEKYWTLKNT